MHTLLFLAPGHFHAALTLRDPHPLVAEEIVVYSPEGPDLRDFLALVDRFNRRAERPARWRPVVRPGPEPLARLVEERRGDAVILAGRTRGKASSIHRLHEAGFHVLADKPWLVGPGDLEDVRASQRGWPLAMEIMTGRHEAMARLARRLVGDAEIFGDIRDDPAGSPAIEIDSVHHLEKEVDGAPLRRPWWFFDVGVQGSGAVDIPTHLVDRTQWLMEGRGAAPDEALELLSARTWATPVPDEAFARITGEPAFPPALWPFVDGDVLAYRGNAEIRYRIHGIAVRIGTRWDLAPPPGGGDSHRMVVRGTRARLRLEQGPRTRHRRQLVVEPLAGAPGVVRALEGALARWQTELPGAGLRPAGEGCHEVVVPAGLDAGHESHFAMVLDEFVRVLDGGQWPGDLAARTVAKYTLLAAAAGTAS